MCRSSPEKNSAPENLRLVRRNQAGSGRRRLTRRSSLHSDRNCISRAAEVGQAHRDSRSRRDAARHSKVHLEIPAITGSISEIQNFGELSADRYLWRNHAAFKQAGGVHRQHVPSSGRLSEWRDLSRVCMPDRILACTIADPRGMSRLHPERN
jgi:hypothetical protein